MLRHVGTTDATVWVETDGACEVEILGHRSHTFHVAGHHYALVVIEDLEPATSYEYDVALDGERVWPPPDYELPPPSLRTLDPGGRVAVVFGSCRAAAPHEPPYTLSPDDHELGCEADALWTYALRLANGEEERPDLVLLLGDQVYVDEFAPQTRAFIRSRRDVTRPPHDEVLDFEEYTHLYREAWSDPPLRWLHSTVGTATIWDDHDVHDDWNTSLEWLEEVRRHGWWQTRIRAAIASYWIYQHLGNLSPRELAASDLYARVRGADDAADILFEFAEEADHDVSAKRWSYARHLGRVRLVVVDSRGGRVLGETRLMVDDEEWAWIESEARGEASHVVLASSLPFLLPRGIDGLQRWNERIVGGRWGRLAARLGERVREALDLEHWASFETSWHRMMRLALELEPRAPVVVVSGDVHYSYLAQVKGKRIFQATCSPLRNPLARGRRNLGRFAISPVGRAIGALLRRGAGVPPPQPPWRLVRGPWFDNAVATLTLDGDRTTLRMEKTERDDPEAHPRLELVYEHRLT